MFTQFDARFTPDEFSQKPTLAGLKGSKFEPILGPYFQRYSGVSCLGGLYRVMDGRTQTLAQRFADEAFNVNRFVCFAYDWLGTIFAVDGARVENGRGLIAILEPFSGRVMEVPTNLAGFHEIELPQHPNDVVAVKLFKEWLTNKGSRPALHQCISHRKPLFLGGKNEIENLELSDLSIHWGLASQLIAQTRDLPAGTKIGKTSIR